MRIYERLEPKSIESLREVYSENVIFEDPAHRIEGLENMLSYFNSMYENVNECRFEFESVLIDEELVALAWTMHLRHPKLKGGLPIQVEGSSILEIAGNKVERHRDYFDLGAMVYEHIPLLGRVVTGIKHRLGQ